MAKKGGDKRTKRQLAPAFWDIKRKEGQFIVRTNPGGHPKGRSYPLGIFLRDVIKVVKTMNEAEKILNHAKVKVDGFPRYDTNYPVGLMDIVELVGTELQLYRLVPKDSRILSYVNIDESERNLKPLKIKTKHLVENNAIQYGSHDGKTFLSEEKYSVGDTVVFDLKNKKIIQEIKIEPGNLVLITSGENAGIQGKIGEIKQGTFSIPRRVVLDLESRSVELPTDMVMAIGQESPVIKVK